MVLLEAKGDKFCLVNNLNASNKGCNKPIIETLFGPKRIWNNPITFRSKSVKKATDNKIKRIWIIQETDSKIIQRTPYIEYN